MKLMAGGGAVPPPKSQPEARMSSGRTAEPSTTSRHALATAPFRAAPPEDELHHGVRMSSLREIILELEERRKIDLRYEIERYVRPAEIDFGHFNYTAAPGAPHDLSMRIKAWLEEVSGVEWQVIQSDEGARESTAERRERKRSEQLEAVATHPRIAEALRLFKGARIVRVDEPEAVDELDDQPVRANVIHVDFARERPPGDAHLDPEAIPYEEREDDD